MPPGKKGTVTCLPPRGCGRVVTLDGGPAASAGPAATARHAPRVPARGPGFRLRLDALKPFILLAVVAGLVVGVIVVTRGSSAGAGGEAAEPLSDADVEAILRNGGTHWSSEPYTSRTVVRLWPEEDLSYKAKPGVGFDGARSLEFRCHWRLEPGKHFPLGADGKPAVFARMYFRAGLTATEMAQALNLDPLATEGTVAFSTASLKYSGKASFHAWLGASLDDSGRKREKSSGSTVEDDAPTVYSNALVLEADLGR